MSTNGERKKWLASDEEREWAWLCGTIMMTIMSNKYTNMDRWIRWHQQQQHMEYHKTHADYADHVDDDALSESKSNYACHGVKRERESAREY